jgi:hypothetical protein
MNNSNGLSEELKQINLMTPLFQHKRKLFNPMKKNEPKDLRSLYLAENNFKNVFITSNFEENVVQEIKSSSLEKQFNSMLK